MTALVPYLPHVDELVRERRNSIANAVDLRLSCTNPSICALLSPLSTRSLRSDLNRAILQNHISDPQLGFSGVLALFAVQLHPTYRDICRRFLAKRQEVVVPREDTHACIKVTQVDFPLDALAVTEAVTA